MSADYTDPDTSSSESDWSRTIDRDFDVVWQSLIDHVSGTFFAIDNFEKESGLITLSFGASNIDDFVDGGQWTFKRTAGPDPITGAPITALEFEGNYAEYTERHLNAELTGSMNIFVREIESDRTVVKVRARYVVVIAQATTGGLIKNTWSFDTGGSDTVMISNPTKGTPPTRTFTPTHLAEKTILSAVELLASED
ncbi:MAG: hypothetical protein ACYS26_16670 [Planctomycetota bacterium]|jgi:hypothetical protein